MYHGPENQIFAPLIHRSTVSPAITSAIAERPERLFQQTRRSERQRRMAECEPCDAQNNWGTGEPVGVNCKATPHEMPSEDAKRKCRSGDRQDVDEADR